MESQSGQGPSAQQGDNSLPVGPSPVSADPFGPIITLLRESEEFRKEAYQTASKHLRVGSLNREVVVLSDQLKEARKETKGIVSQ